MGASRRADSPLTALSLLSAVETERASAAFPELTFIRIEPEGDIAPGVAGEILLTGAACGNFVPALNRGVNWVHTLSAGVDNFPLDALGDRTLTCARGNAGIAISEWVLAVMLAYEKRLPESWTNSAATPWFRADLGTLSGRRLGLIGIGGIGSEIARRALPFGMQVTALRRRSLPPPFPGVEVVTQLDELLRSSDHLVLAAPSTSLTLEILDARALSRVKAGVHLVNVSRGRLIDHDALRVALDSGQVDRASLDVTDPEPLPAGHWIYSHPRVRLSPHISWSAPWGLDRVFSSFGVNLQHYLDGEPLVDVVAAAEGY